jgi:mannose-1-phosphate guanylyltransferase
LAQSPGENVAINADHYPLDSKGILLQGNKKLVVTIGLENVAIIETDDAILVCDLNRTQDVKQVVEHLKNTQQTHYL